MLAPERDPVLDAEADPAVRGVFREGPLGLGELGVLGVADAAADESNVCSASICKSNDEPHFVQAEISSAFPVRQWGQIIDCACSFLSLVRSSGIMTRLHPPASKPRVKAVAQIRLPRVTRLSGLFRESIEKDGKWRT